MKQDGISLVQALHVIKSSQGKYFNVAWENTLKSIEEALERVENAENLLGMDVYKFAQACSSEYIYIIRKTDGTIFECDIALDINCDEDGIYIDYDCIHEGKYYLKDYGVTWALTKEELK